MNNQIGLKGLEIENHTSEDGTLAGTADTFAMGKLNLEDDSIKLRFLYCNVVAQDIGLK